MKPSSSVSVFAVSRGIFDDPDFANEPFTQREAFMWLVASAAWKQVKTRGSRGSIILERGEFCFAIRYLAGRWQWSKSRVERFISMLKNRDIIGDTKRDNEIVWKINKYNDFQIVGLPKRDAERDTNRDDAGTRAGQERDKEETGKQVNISSSLRSEEKAAPSALSILGDVLDADRCKAVLEHRKAKRAKNTAYAIGLLAAQLKACPDPKAAADEMILRNWTSVKPEWLERDKQRGQSPPKPSITAAAQRHEDGLKFLNDLLEGKVNVAEDPFDGNTIDLDADYGNYAAG